MPHDFCGPDNARALVPRKLCVEVCGKCALLSLIKGRVMIWYMGGPTAGTDHQHIDDDVENMDGNIGGMLKFAAMICHLRSAKYLPWKGKCPATVRKRRTPQLQILMVQLT